MTTLTDEEEVVKLLLLPDSALRITAIREMPPGTRVTQVQALLVPVRQEEAFGRGRPQVDY